MSAVKTALSESDPLGINASVKAQTDAMRLAEPRLFGEHCLRIRDFPENIQKEFLSNYAFEKDDSIYFIEFNDHSVLGEIITNSNLEALNFLLNHPHFNVNQEFDHYFGTVKIKLSPLALAIFSIVIRSTLTEIRAMPTPESRDESRNKLAFETMQTLVAKGANVNYILNINPAPASALPFIRLLASMLPLIPLTQLLEQPVEVGIPLLHLVASLNNKAAFELFVQYGADIDAEERLNEQRFIGANVFSQVVIQRCKKHEGSALLIPIISCGARIDIPISSQGKTILELLTQSININKTILSTVKAAHDLFVACMENNVKRATACLSLGASVHQRNFTGDTPLHMACTKSNTEMVRYLLSQGARLNAKNDAEKTSLETLSCLKDSKEQQNTIGVLMNVIQKEVNYIVFSIRQRFHGRRLLPIDILRHCAEILLGSNSLGLSEHCTPETASYITKAFERAANSRAIFQASLRVHNAVVACRKQNAENHAFMRELCYSFPLARAASVEVTLHNSPHNRDPNAKRNT